MYRCKNGSCLNRTRVCDLTKDCAEGEDEEDDCGNCQNYFIIPLTLFPPRSVQFVIVPRTWQIVIEKGVSDKIPENARCNFEHGWCGWKNVPGRPLNWTLHRGATPSEKTGPSYDHTYRNASGSYIVMYMYVHIMPSCAQVSMKLPFSLGFKYICLDLL